jgi:membrane protein
MAILAQGCKSDNLPQTSMVKPLSKLQKLLEEARLLLDEKWAHQRSGRLHRFMHFWVMVGRSFIRNRCPVRASALAYATLLALIPMLAVVMSITSTFLKKQGEDRIDQFISKVVISVTTSIEAGTNVVAGGTNLQVEASAPAADNASMTNETGVAGEIGEARLGELSKLAQEARAIEERKAISRKINEFIQNTRSGALGLTGSVLLIFAAISMLSRIETTFNDIWGVGQGRSWFMRVVLYWGVLSLAPILLVVALGLATGPHLETTKHLVESMPFVGRLVKLGYQVLPVIVLCLAFGLFYMLMPNTQVDWRAALAGGFAGGLLFHLNDLVSVLYVSRVVSNSKIYGSLGLVPVFMIGLYFSWLILLFGAQVAYAFQNRQAYLEEKQVESVNQRGREFIALRLMTCIGRRFSRGEPPPRIAEISEELSVPSRLVRQIMQTLIAARLACETAGSEVAYMPARTLESITCHDVLLAMRASQGQELATRDEPSRAEVLGEYQRIQEAERLAASSVTLLALANRAAPRLEQGSGS